jgi:hypothetical protein
MTADINTCKQKLHFIHNQYPAVTSWSEVKNTTAINIYGFVFLQHVRDPQLSLAIL